MDNTIDTTELKETSFDMNVTLSNISKDIFLS